MISWTFSLRDCCMRGPPCMHRVLAHDCAHACIHKPGLDWLACVSSFLQRMLLRCCRETMLPPAFSACLCVAALMTEWAMVRSPPVCVCVLWSCASSSTGPCWNVCWFGPTLGCGPLGVALVRARRRVSITRSLHRGDRVQHLSTVLHAKTWCCWCGQAGASICIDVHCCIGGACCSLRACRDSTFPSPIMGMLPEAPFPFCPDVLTH